MRKTMYLMFAIPALVFTWLGLMTYRLAEKFGPIGKEW